jgi:AraC family transcriptional regulator, glycine betaine-responsive activator
MSFFSPSSEAISVTILLLADSSLMSLASTLDPMRAANRAAEKKLFDWQIATFDGKAAKLTCGIEIPPDAMFSSGARGDALIVISGFNQDRHASRKQIGILAKAARGYRAIGAVEAGPWLLARAGLLDGKSATTHWEDFEEFAARFPNVDVRADRFVIDGDVFTSGAASPAFDMMLHMIRSRYGAPLALEVASIFVYDEAHAANDAQPLVSLGRLKGFEPRVSEAIRLMEASIDAPLSVSSIAKRLKLTQRSLEMIFKKALNRSPGDFYLKLRLQAARRMVADTRLSMQDVAIRTGFSSHTTFSRMFRQVYGASPRDYRKNAS